MKKINNSKSIKDICNEDEYRDLYDENKNNTYERIKKGNKIPKNKYYITVVIFIENDKGELLLQVNKKFNKWSITGGHPKSGETSLQGAQTELKEELNIDIPESELKLFKTIKTEDDFVDLYYLRKNIELKDITIEPNEVSDVNWFTKEEIDKLINNKEFLEAHIELYNCFLDNHKLHEEERMKIRKASIEDADQIVSINVFSWKDTYKNIFPDNFLDSLDPNSTESIEKCKKSIDQYAVCELNGEVVGMVRYGKNKKGLSDNCGEIYALYLKSGFKNKGIGTKLVEFAFNELKANYDIAVISTLVQNPANEFYKKIGGKLIDKCDFKLGDKLYTENVYEYELSK